MSKHDSLPVHADEQAGNKVAVVLCNLGTPDSATPAGVKKFLAPFLGDQRVVELPRLLWWPILYGIILPLRSRKVAKAYAEIWWEEGSPLKVITQRQAQGLQQRLADLPVTVTYAMSYSQPGIATTLAQLQSDGVEKVCVLPLYPQYSATTTASIVDQLAAYLTSRRDLPAIHIIRDYHDHPSYISALANSIRKHRKDNGSGDHLLFSFHGIPEVNVKKGDPYQRHCERTAHLVAEALDLSAEKWSLSFQSRFGKQEWLKPYTTNELIRFAEKKIAIDVICPAFASDCLETLEEIAQENRQEFLDAGGKQFKYIPCLNDGEDHIELMYSLVYKYIS